MVSTPTEIREWNDSLRAAETDSRIVQAFELGRQRGYGEGWAACEAAVQDARREQEAWGYAQAPLEPPAIVPDVLRLPPWRAWLYGRLLRRHKPLAALAVRLGFGLREVWRLACRTATA